MSKFSCMLFKKLYYIRGFDMILVSEL